ncbi:alpha/beta hydrolase [Anaerolineae bacterium CFX9]|nr:alpha/beta hydrolase [Anaerolineae bacterium CFX9]
MGVQLLTDEGEALCYNPHMASFTITRSGELHYLCSGSGDDVLLIHGWASSSRMWQRVHDHLSGDFRLWSIDLPGFGASSLPDDAPVSIDDHLNAIIGFCRQHNLRPSAVVGHSMGGMLALRLALEQPEMVDRLVLVCPVVSGRMALRVETFFSSSAGRFIAARTKSLWSLMQSQMLAPVFSAPVYVSRSEHARYIQDFRRASWRAAIGALESIAQQDLTPQLAKIPHETLVMVGQRDFTVPPAEGRLAAERMPAARLVDLPGVHHQPLDEAPAQFINLMRNFLCRTPA